MEKAVLFSEMTPDATWEGEFNAWYDDEHIPLRMAVPGFVGAQRYKRNQRDYLAVYDLDETATLTSDAYGEVKNKPSDMTARMLRDVSGFTRYIGRPIGCQINDGVEDFLKAPVLYPVFFNIPQANLTEFDDWYDQDHVPTLLECPEWLAVRRFHLEISDPGNYNRLALHYLADESAMDSDARKKARASEWRDRLANQPWFKGHYMVFGRHNDRFVSSL